MALSVDSRPRFLNLIKIALPVAGLMSIAHRISGFVMCLSLPFFILIFELSLQSQATFIEIHSFFESILGLLFLFLFLWALLHHLLAGIRYLLIDAGFGVERAVFKKTAWEVLILAPIFAVILTGLIAP